MTQIHLDASRIDFDVDGTVGSLKYVGDLSACVRGNLGLLSNCHDVVVSCVHDGRITFCQICLSFVS